MIWLPSGEDMHFVLGFLLGGTIVGFGIGPNIEKRGRHHPKRGQR